MIFGSWFAFQLSKSSNSDSFLDGLLFLFIGVVGLLLFIRTIFRDTKEYSMTKEIAEFVPTITGLCFIVVILSIFYYQNRRANAPTLLRVFYDGGFNGVSIDFKVDGSYILANGSGLGQSYFYGTYVLADSIITLDKENIDNVIKSNTLVIRTTQYYLPVDSTINLNSKRANYITQVDKNGKEIDKDFRLRVIQDYRK